MTLYLDTSVLVSALTNEPDSDRILGWLEEQSDALTISDWVTAEFSSALSIKLTTGQMGVADRADALRLFASWRTDVLTSLPVSGSHFHTAARFADQYLLGLRAADALHLAIVADAGATLCTRDRRQSEAGLSLGVSTALL